MEDDKITTGDWALDPAFVIGVKTENYGLIQELRDESSMETGRAEISIASMRHHNKFHASYFSLDYLKDIIDYMVAGDATLVKLEAGKELPIILTGVNEYSDQGKEDVTQAILAPRIREEVFDTVNEPEYNGFTEYKVESIENDWENTYPTREKAIDAAQEHLYLTGSQARIIKPNGELLSF